MVSQSDKDNLINQTNAAITALQGVLQLAQALDVSAPPVVDTTSLQNQIDNLSVQNSHLQDIVNMVKTAIAGV